MSGHERSDVPMPIIMPPPMPIMPPMPDIWPKIIKPAVLSVSWLSSGGDAVVFAEIAHGAPAASPSFDQSAPVLCFAGIAGLALWHGQGLQDTGEENRVPRVTAVARTGSTVRLPSARRRRKPGHAGRRAPLPAGAILAPALAGG